jgi:hypothetical protein
MQTVIYSQHLEPITVVDLTMEMLKSLKINRRIVLTLSETEQCRLYAIGMKIPSLEYGETEGMLLITPDEVEALKLKAGWLPGQRSAINFAIHGVRMMKEKLINYMRRNGDAA